MAALYTAILSSRVCSTLPTAAGAFTSCGHNRTGVGFIKLHTVIQTWPASSLVRRYQYIWNPDAHTSSWEPALISLLMPRAFQACVPIRVKQRCHGSRQQTFCKVLSLTISTSFVPHLIWDLQIQTSLLLHIQTIELISPPTCLLLVVLPVNEIKQYQMINGQSQN